MDGMCVFRMKLFNLMCKLCINICRLIQFEMKEDKIKIATENLLLFELACDDG